ncbi:excision repair cross-complementing rodent repair deficiency complementation group 1, partial [Conidiobolus coronatus NRRL 28638]
RGNPILSNVRAVPWEYKDIVPDYVVGKTTCVLYLSLKYHKLYPDYIFQRVQKLRSNYQLRIILCRVDIPDPDRYLLELTKLTMNANLTLLLSWNDEEAG